MENEKGYIYILVGPSAGGKTTLFKGITEGYYILSTGEKKVLTDDCSGISGKVKRIITATTRKPRSGEKDGVHYRFLKREEFENERNRGEIIEETLYAGESYGILASEINKILEEGLNGVIILDCHGVKELKRKYADRAISIFVYRDLEKIHEALKKRGCSEAEINQRLNIAVEELEMKDSFDYIIYNTKSLGESLNELCSIIHKTTGGF